MNDQKVFELKTKIITLNLAMLEKATIVYDQLTDTLHINLSEEEAEETILLENGIVVRVKNDKLIGLSVQSISKHG
jgi:uncharacterized protein YuzE